MTVRARRRQPAHSIGLRSHVFVSTITLCSLVRQDGTAFTHKARILPRPRRTPAQPEVRRAAREVPAVAEGGCTILVGRARWRPCWPRPTAEKGLARSTGISSSPLFDSDPGRGGEELPPVRESQQPLGRHLEGCRIGFDLGGTDRKCAAVIDGKVVFSDEVVWDPYSEKNPWYHFDGINDTLRRAAAHLPRIDAIGGSAAGVYVNNEPGWARSTAASPSPTSTATSAASSARCSSGGRGALRGRERRRGDRARRLHVPEGERGPRLLHGNERRRRLRDAGGQHHLLAQRAGLRADRLPRRRAGRRVVGRLRLRGAVLLAAGGEPATAGGGHRGARGDAARRAPRRGAEADGPGRLPGPEDLRDDRHVLRLRDRALRPVLRHRERARAGPGHVRGGRRGHPRRRPAGPEGRVPGARGDDPPADAGREGQAPRPGDRGGEPARRLKERERRSGRR